MDKIIKLNSRYNSDNYLKLLEKPDGSESKTYVLVTESPTVRLGYTNAGVKFLDPDGGPMIVADEIIPGTELKVKFIEFIPEIGHVITFE